jgi:hypothetical protein
VVAVEVLFERVAGLDVGKESLTAAGYPITGS